MTGEKRRYMRFNVLLDAICRKNGNQKKLKVNNFSKEGVGILSKESFSEGENVEIELMIPGDNVPVLLQGEIAWSSDPIVDNIHHKSGMKFQKVSNEDRSRILEYIYHKWMMPASADAK
ncbi:MAG: PilZ domain-containing protein [Candidatus Omnitrophota bacterium]